MTIAAGFRCFDGVLLATDSEHTVGQSKYKAQKIFEVRCGDFFSGAIPECSRMLVAGAGDNGAISEVVESLGNSEEVYTQSVTFEGIERAIRRCKLGKGATVLIGVKVYTERQARLLRVEEDDYEKIRITQFWPTSEYSCTFTGTEVAESICREISYWLYSSGLPVLSMREIAKHLLGRAISHSLYCDFPVQIDYLFDTGCAQLARDIALPDYGKGYLCGVHTLLGNAFCGCVDPTVSDERFEKSLQSLVDKLREVRNDTLNPK
ncbi:MAG: hypothetical protein ABSF71_31945 [Terriglobia bacterium]|jgi:hypothetical protein